MSNSSFEDRTDRVDFDDVIKATGFFGRYHFLHAVLLIGIEFAVAFPLLSIVFIGYEVPHTCSTITNTTIESIPDIVIHNSTELTYETCQIQVKNNVSGVLQTTSLPCLAGHNYTSSRVVSFVSEWDLVCDRAGLAELSQTTMTVGQGVGGLLASVISDKYGRRPVFIFHLLGLWAMSLALGFSPNVLVYIIIRVFIGGFQQGASVSSFTMLVEMLPTTQRPLAGTMAGMIWSVAVMALAPTAYLMKDAAWSYLQIILSCVCLYVFILPCTLDESLRWLIANNKYDQAEKVVRRAARMNRTDVAKAVDTLTRFIAAESQTLVVNSSEQDAKSKMADASNALLVNGNGVTKEFSNSVTDKQYSILDLFRHKHIFITSLITWYIWTVNSLTYFGLYLTSTSLTGNRFVNFFLYGLVELPSTICVYVALRRFGRRQVSMACHFLAGVTLLLSVIIFSTKGDTAIGGTLATVFNLAGMFAVTGSFNCLFIYIPELYPTNLRSAGLGMGSTMSRIGGMTAPFSRQLISIVTWGPGAIFGGACLVATYLIRYLPETKGTELPTTIEECNEMFKHARIKK